MDGGNGKPEPDIIWKEIRKNPERGYYPKKGERRKGRENHEKSHNIWFL